MARHALYIKFRAAMIRSKTQKVDRKMRPDNETEMTTIHEYIEQLSSSYKEPSDVTDDLGLYDLMDLVPNSRKTMNFLFRTSGPVIDSLPAVQQSNASILDSWLVTEGQESKVVGTIADSSITFSWRNKSLDTPKVHVKVKDMNDTKLSTTNSALYKIVYDKLSHLEIPFDSRDNSPASSNTPITDENSETEKWNKSDFKVDPLKQFIVTELPKEKKVVLPKKKKNYKWFWSSSKSSHKHDGHKAQSQETLQNVSQLSRETAKGKSKHLQPDVVTKPITSNVVSLPSSEIANRETERTAKKMTNTNSSSLFGADENSSNTPTFESSTTSLLDTPSEVVPMSISSFKPLKPSSKYSK